MTPRARGLFAGGLALAWFAFGADRAVQRLDGFRAPPRGQRTAAEFTAERGAAALTPAEQALTAEAAGLSRQEASWGYVVASLLSPDERAAGLALVAATPPRPAAPGATLEPEMPALIDAILSRHGPATLPAPQVAPREDWQTADRRMRARVLTALVEGPGLDDERAAIVLGATLNLLAVQARRTEIEAELAEL